MPVEMQTVNVNKTVKKKNNPVQTGAQIGAAIGIGKIGIDTFRGANRVRHITGNEFFKQLEDKVDEIATSEAIKKALNETPLGETVENLTKRSNLQMMIDNVHDIYQKPNTDEMLSIAKELGAKVEKISFSKKEKALYCGVVFGIFTLISAGIGSLIGAGAGKIVEIFKNKKETEKQEFIEQVKTELKEE